MSYGGGGGNPYGNSPQQYSTPQQYSAPYNNGGYDEEHELQSYGSPSQPLNGGGRGGGGGGDDNTLPLVDFLNRIDQLRTQIGAIEGNTEALRRVQEASMQQSDSTQARGQIEQMTADIQQQINAIKNELTVKLADDASHTTNTGVFNTKKSQLEAAVNSFRIAAQAFRGVEQEFRRKFRDQLVRQYQIVNPDSSDNEAEMFIDNSDNQNMFEQAVQNSRTGQARTVLGNVRARHDELLRIEQNITELAEMFQDLDAMVIKQEAIIMQVHEQAEVINENFKEGNQHVDTGIKSAKNRRKLKWWCLLVVVLIIIAIALGVGLGVALNKSPSSNNNNGNNGNNNNNDNNNNNN